MALKWTQPFENGMAEHKLLPAKDVFVLVDGVEVGIDTLIEQIQTAVGGKVDVVSNPETGKQYVMTSAGWQEVEIKGGGDLTGEETEDPDDAPIDPLQQIELRVEKLEAGREILVPRAATEDDYIDDPIDPIVAGDYLLDIHEDTPNGVVYWNNPTGTLHVFVYSPEYDENYCTHNVRIYAENGAKVCIENCHYCEGSIPDNPSNKTIFFDIIDGVYKEALLSDITA